VGSGWGVEDARQQVRIVGCGEDDLLIQRGIPGE
jgi:hypothetical protein